MTILIQYQDQKAMIENLGDDTANSDVKYHVLNTLLPQLRIHRDAVVDDFEIDIDHPEQDRSEFLIKQAKEALGNLYW